MKGVRTDFWRYLDKVYISAEGCVLGHEPSVMKAPHKLLVVGKLRVGNSELSTVLQCASTVQGRVNDGGP
jgi:hypothetical protein